MRNIEHGEHVTNHDNNMSLRNRVGYWSWYWLCTSSALLPHFEWRHDDYRRIYMYHVRKTAGTSVAFALMRLAHADPHLIDRRLARFCFAQGNGYRYVANHEALLRQGKYFFAFSHLPAYYVELPQVGTFRFTVLRDPVERVISLYRYLASPEADSSYSHKAPIEERRWAMEGFDRFLDRVPNQHLTNQLHMFSRSSSVNEAIDCLSQLDLVLRTEHIDRGVSDLQEALGLRFSLTRERSSLLPFTPSDAQRSRLHDMLIPEFDILRQIEPRWNLKSSPDL